MSWDKGLDNRLYELRGLISFLMRPVILLDMRHAEQPKAVARLITRTLLVPSNRGIYKGHLGSNRG